MAQHVRQFAYRRHADQARPLPLMQRIILL